MRIMLLTAGSRGDVETFLALARRAQAVGHKMRLGETREFRRAGFGSMAAGDPVARGRAVVTATRAAATGFSSPPTGVGSRSHRN